MSNLTADSLLLSRRALVGAGLSAASLLRVGPPAGKRGGAAVTNDFDHADHERNVPYGRPDQIGSEELILDIYHPPFRPEPRPAVVVVHGGAWVERSRMDWSFNAAKVATAGYVTFNLDYRLMKPDGGNPWPDQFDDVQRAVRWVRSTADAYGVDPERIGAIGHSSGGQLVGLLGTRETRDNSDPALAAFSSRVNCVVNLAGDMDLMIPFPDTYFNDLATRFFGGTRDEVPEVYRDASPFHNIDAQAAPFLILQGALGDPAVEHSRLMEAALREAAIEVIYAGFPDTDHIGVIDWGTMGSLTLAFLDRHLQPNLLERDSPSTGTDTNPLAVRFR